MFSMYLTLPDALGPEVTQPLTEMNTRNRKNVSGEYSMTNK
jgi:hypothetical protein